MARTGSGLGDNFVPKILYFGYGSNMLTTRIGARCHSARFRTVAALHAYTVQFRKRSNDGSGKATLIPTGSATDVVLGVVFEIDSDELLALDRVEGRGYGYERHENFPVLCTRSEHVLETCTYIADKPVDGLRPYCWYLALVLAGIAEHKLDTDYAARFSTHPFDVDQIEDRDTRQDALLALTLAGIPDYMTLFS